VDQIKSRSPNTPYENGFAFVVANPPYGATISREYQEILKTDYSDVFHGHPDTYIFFIKLGIELIANNGRLGFITPSTYLMGINSTELRKILLTKGRIEQIVDLPQGIWTDANVDCVLLFLTEDSNKKNLQIQESIIHVLGLRDTLDKLTRRVWVQTLIQKQADWLNDAKYEINIHYDSLMKQIEEACFISIKNNGKTRKILRLEDVTDSCPGIEPYKTSDDGKANLYIKQKRDILLEEDNWKPLLDGTSFVGRYELRWGDTKPYIRYGNWLSRPRETKYFESPKLLIQSIRNRALKRRLVATFDDQKFYNRKNFINIISFDPKKQDYELKYILALFNSSVLNFWYRNRFDNVNINPSYFRQLPIFPADSQTQAELVEKVDFLLAKNVQLNQFREHNYTIRKQRNGNNLIEIPCDRLLSEIQQTNRQFSTLTLFDAKAAGLFTIPDRCDLRVNISSNVYIPERYPNSIVLRSNKLWLVVEHERLRRYLVNYLKLPQWQGRSWDDIKNLAVIPAENSDLDIFFQTEQQRRLEIQVLLDEVAQIDAEIDEKVLDLYGITEPSDRDRILGNNVNLEEEPENIDNNLTSIEIET